MNENRIRAIFPEDIIGFPGSYRGLKIPEVAVRPQGQPGLMILNQQTGLLEAFSGGEWIVLGSRPAPSEGPKIDLFEHLTAGANVRLDRDPAGKLRIQVPVVGDNTVGDNIGTGTGSIYRGKTGTVLQLRRLVSDTHQLHIETDADTIRFSLDDPGEPTLGRSLGTGLPIFVRKHGPELVFNSFQPDPTGLNGQVGTNGEISLGLAENLTLPGKRGVRLPIGSVSEAGVSEPGLIRYNSESEQYQVGLRQGWATLSTDRGTFLPMIGGRLSGMLYTDAGLTVTKQDLVLDGGVLRAGPNRMEINFENGGKIVTGLNGLIDGYRFPAIAATADAISKVAPGLIMRTKEGYTSGNLRGTEEQIIIAGLDLSLAANPSLPGTASVLLPQGPDSSRDERVGAIRYNQSGRFEGRHPSGWQSLASTDHGEFSVLNVSGDVFIQGKLNGRDLSEDSNTISSLDAVRGLGFRNDQGWSSAKIISDPDRPGIHISDNGAEIRIGFETSFRTEMVYSIKSLLGASAVLSGSHIHGRTIDGRDLAQDGVWIDSLNQIGNGMLVRIGPYQFASRAIIGSVLPESRGISVDNADGVAGDIKLGLRLSGLPEVDQLEGSDWIIVSTASGNARISFDNLIKAVHAGKV